MDVSGAVVASSVVVQLLSAVLAFRIIRTNARHGAGYLVLLAIVLMAFRRTVSLYRYLTDDRAHLDIVAEAIALAISLLIFGVVIHLERLLKSVKILSGLLPICASCKKIRDERGGWTVMEKYIREHSRAEFTHGLCPECVSRLYPGLLPTREPPSPTRRP